MNCEQAQQEILGWENLDAELAAHPEVAAHVAGCKTCPELIGKLKKLEAAAKGMSLPEGYATVPPAFLRKVAEAEKGCCGRSWRGVARRAIAAVIIVAVGLAAVMLFFSNGQQARADVVLDQLLSWDLEIANTKDAGERAKIYQAHVAEMNASRGKLSPEDQKVADRLLDTAQWMTTESDPLAEGERFVEIAQEINSRAGAVKDAAVSAGLERVCQRVVQEGVAGRVKQVNPAGLTPEKKLELEGIQKDVEQIKMPPQTGPSGALPRTQRSPIGSGGTVVYVNSGSVSRTNEGVYEVGVGPVASGNTNSGPAMNWTGSGGSGGVTVQRSGGGGYGTRGSAPAAAASGGSGNAPAATGGDHANARDGAAGTDDAKDPSGMDSPSGRRGSPNNRPEPGINPGGSWLTGNVPPGLDKMPSKGYGPIAGEPPPKNSDAYGSPPPLRSGPTLKPAYDGSDATATDQDDLTTGQKITDNVSDAKDDDGEKKIFHKHEHDADKTNDQRICEKADGEDSTDGFDKPDVDDKTDYQDKHDFAKAFAAKDAFGLKKDSDGDVPKGNGVMQMTALNLFAVQGTPEPGSGLLLLLGGVLLARRGRRAERV